MRHVIVAHRTKLSAQRGAHMSASGVFLWRHVPKEASLTFAPSLPGTRLGQVMSCEVVNYYFLNMIFPLGLSV
jgi:hypothetical protein